MPSKMTVEIAMRCASVERTHEAEPSGTKTPKATDTKAVLTKALPTTEE
jgi:hypothetical protein